MEKDLKTQWLKYISKLQAIAQNGLTYCSDPFDKERYLQLMDLASEIAANCIPNLDKAEIYNIFAMEKGYATPKIDVRAFIVENDQLLLVRERSDSLWTLPGGWADINESPSEAILKEVKEETGFNASIIRLLAIWDKLKHDHPLRWPHTYKCFFHCKRLEGAFQENIEILELAFFSFDNLPELSTDRVTRSELIKLWEIVSNGSPTAYD